MRGSETLWRTMHNHQVHHRETPCACTSQRDTQMQTSRRAVCTCWTARLAHQQQRSVGDTLGVSRRFELFVRTDHCDTAKRWGPAAQRRSPHAQRHTPRVSQSPTTHCTKPADRSCDFASGSLGNRALRRADTSLQPQDGTLPLRVVIFPRCHRGLSDR